MSSGVMRIVGDKREEHGMGGGARQFRRRQRGYDFSFRQIGESEESEVS